MSHDREYKYATEAEVSFNLMLYRICQQDEFEAIQQSGFDEHLKYYNIYFVCQRNRIGIQPRFINVDDDSIDLRFDVWVQDTKFTVPFGINNDFGTNELFIKSKYPHNYFWLTNNKGEKLQPYKSSYLLDKSYEEDSNFKIVPRPSFLDLEILYIGQATRNSKKPVIDRLIGHNKLQMAYLVANQKNPDKEIFIILCAFIADAVVTTRGSIKTKKKFEKEDEKRLKRFYSEELKLTSKQEATIAEAALIRYFQPKYNTQHKKSFPTKKNSSYEICYKLDLKSVSFSLETELYFFTDSIKTSNTHSGRFSINTDEDRAEVFDF